MLIKPSCIIFSHPSDVHVTAVLENLDKGTVPYILDFGEFCRSFGASLKLGEKSALQLTSSSGDRLEVSELETIWWRRPQPIYAEVPSDIKTHSFVNEEYLRFWQSALAVLAALPNVRWYNPYKKNETADCKFRQLEVATEVGLSVPKTIATNVYEDAINFIKQNNSKTIFKSFAGNEDFWQPTRPYKDTYENHLKDSIGFCPIILQEYIDGAYDYRIIVIDDQIFPVRFCLKNSRYPYDVRIDIKNKAESATLNDELRTKILAFMKNYGIRYGAFDFREDLQGDLYFLEVNPAGQFLYLDHLAGTTIARAMAAALSSNRSSISRTFQKVSHTYYPGNNLPFSAVVPDRIEHIN
ncbi:hypothetical protein IB252_05420 [Pseudomonas sp. PDM10]|uniref:hypothetical protein n=1 Tax=Pseudomonas sp. PDM10 TaxID=2769269 RepID=UPI00177F1137|nr:hypothetical protein [Pseudomonas sp. PDM10]MBD9599277.1 hypothetical protein [Pseudomonas sp. PDM10]